MILEIDAAPDHVFRIPTHPVSVGFCLTADYNDLLQSSQDAILAPGDLRHRMSISLYHPGRKQRWLLLVLALVFQGNVVSADSLSSPAFDAEAHAKVCKCGPLCRHASCCCGRPSVAERGDRGAPAISTPHADFASSAPCLEEAPCGDSGLPPTAGPRLQEKAATLVECVSRSALMMSNFLPVHTSCGRPRWRPSRIPRPPRRGLPA
jgi:hypothetical protein